VVIAVEKTVLYKVFKSAPQNILVIVTIVYPFIVYFGVNALLIRLCHVFSFICTFDDKRFHGETKKTHAASFYISVWCIGRGLFLGATNRG